MSDKIQANNSGNNETISPTQTPGYPVSPAEGILQIRNILLGDLVLRWESKINKMEAGVRELIRKTEAKLAAMEEKINMMDKELKEELETNLMDIEQENDELRALVDNLKKDFEKKIKHLMENKLDKDSIAEVFIQWGQQVKSIMK